LAHLRYLQSLPLEVDLFLALEALGDGYHRQVLKLVFKVKGFVVANLLFFFHLSCQIATRWVAAKYGVQLSPTFMIPSNWTGCLGVVNNYESLLPSKKALFDIAATRVTSSYLASLLLAATAFLLDQSWNGGDNAL